MNDTETNGVLVILVSEGSPAALAGIIMALQKIVLIQVIMYM
jgi:hypothetical protein